MIKSTHLPTMNIHKALKPLHKLYTHKKIIIFFFLHIQNDLRMVHKTQNKCRK